MEIKSELQLNCITKSNDGYGNEIRNETRIQTQT